MIELERDAAVFVLTMKAGENRFHPVFLEALGEALDEVEASEGPAALVTTGEGKFYSNGLDLAWMRAQGAAALGPFVASFQRLLGRLLAFPLPCIAALNGHAFAGGAMFALAQDFRVVREDRGFFCIPEVDLGLPLAPGLMALLRARLPRTMLHEAIVTGRRYGGPDLVAAGIAEASVPEALVLPRAIERAAALAGKDRTALVALKRGIYADALAALEATPARVDRA
jgi:enoyl-CoA hydratase/carnithine racemase